jgi:PIN like domain
MTKEKLEKENFDIFIANSIYPEASSIFTTHLRSLEAIKDDCYIILDTNALLVPYTISKDSLNQIRQTYQNLVERDRLVIPGQVAREFAKNRATRLSELYRELSKKRDEIPSLKKGFYPLLGSLGEYQQVLKLEENINKEIKEYREKIGMVLESIRKWTWNDPVSLLYSELFTKAVINDVALDKDEIKNDLDRRQIHSIPPGYKDAGKQDKGIGDLLIWYSILNIGKTKKQNVIFVSGDGKPDWWHQSNNQPLYPRYELVDEFRRASEGSSFHIITFSDFLNLYGASERAVEEVRQEEVQFQIQHSQEQPKIKLIVLASEIERELRFLIASMGLLQKSQGQLLNDLNLLVPYGFSEMEKTKFFWSIRNQNIHGYDTISDDILLALEYGLSILKSLKSIQHEVNIVYHPGVLIYSDPDCYRVQEFVKGIILENRRYPGDTFTSFRIFPTTLTHFINGKIVSWEWNMNNIWGESWYRDPDTHEIKSAWSSSAEFIGRDLDNLR